MILTRLLSFAQSPARCSERSKWRGMIPTLLLIILRIVLSSDAGGYSPLKSPTQGRKSEIRTSDPCLPLLLTILRIVLSSDVPSSRSRWHGIVLTLPLPSPARRIFFA